MFEGDVKAEHSSTSKRFNGGTIFGTANFFDRSHFGITSILFHCLFLKFLLLKLFFKINFEFFNFNFKTKFLIKKYIIK